MALEKLAALWKRDGKEGYSGKLEDGRPILLVKNGFKKAGSSEPDLRLLLITDDKDTSPKKMPAMEDDVPF